MVWKFCEIWKILLELAFKRAKFCEILPHSVRDGMCETTPWGKMFMSTERPYDFAQLLQV